MTYNVFSGTLNPAQSKTWYAACSRPRLLQLATVEELAPWTELSVTED